MSEPLPTSWLLAALGVLLLFSAFFSSSETALMSINRYRLRHRARSGHRGARLTEALLRRPDRLIGLILLGNNLANFSASALATLIAARIGWAAVVISVVVFTFILLIFAELAPKTFAALRPAKIAIPAAYVYYPMLKVMYPLVWMVNGMANGLLYLMGVRAGENSSHQLSSEELRTVVNESAVLVPNRHRRMLTAILDLGKATVEDIMIPRQDIVGIDLQDTWGGIINQLENSAHTRLPVFDGTLDNTIGVLHLRKIIGKLNGEDFNHEGLQRLIDQPYFIPEGTSLNRQLLNFQSTTERVALVVDEYGDLQGLITLQDILEEIVGEFTVDHPADFASEVTEDEDGGYLVNGSASIRVINRTMQWQLPTEGPKTINGLITEYLETIPEPGTSLTIGFYKVDIVHTADNVIKTVRIHAPTTSETVEV